METLLKNFILKNKIENTKYDCLIMFSGGKDSTFLAHYFKKIFGKKVCLFSVDNSFEDNTFLAEVAGKLDLDLFVFRPSEEELIKYYNFIISKKELKNINSNPLCYLCNQYFSSLAIHFADKLGIPMVINGITMAQILGNNFTLSKRLIKIADTSIETKFKSTYDTLKNTFEYQNDTLLKSIIDNIFIVPTNIKIIYPFLYLDYHIENIKQLLENEYDWKNPDPNATNKKYASWGCNLANIFGLLEKKLSYKTHELDQFELAYLNGTLSKEAYEYSKNNIQNILTKEIDLETKEIIKKLKLEDILLENTEENKSNGL